MNKNWNNQLCTFEMIGGSASIDRASAGEGHDGNCAQASENQAQVCLAIGRRARSGLTVHRRIEAAARQWRRFAALQDLHARSHLYCPHYPPVSLPQPCRSLFLISNIISFFF